MSQSSFQRCIPNVQHIRKMMHNGYRKQLCIYAGFLLKNKAK
ncbi:MAG: hypothetical protein CNLJKLNK_00217 [Holosporales bacterium]